MTTLPNPDGPVQSVLDKLTQKSAISAEELSLLQTHVDELERPAQSTTDHEHQNTQDHDHSTLY